MPKCWQIDLNCKKHTECIKNHHFEIRNQKIFWGGGTAPPQTLRQGGCVFGSVCLNCSFVCLFVTVSNFAQKVLNGFS